MAHTYVILLDGSLGTAMPGGSGGHVIPVPGTMNAGVALRLAKEAAAAASHRRNLRIFCHGRAVEAADGSLVGGYGLNLGATSIGHANVEKAFAIVRDAFASIVFLACATAEYTPNAPIGGPGDGPGFCLKAAAAANTPVYAAAQPQRIVTLGFGQVAMYKDWFGPVHRYTPAGRTEIVKAS